MFEQTITPPTTGAGAFAAILPAGLLAGALDITAACLHGRLLGRSPVTILQSVAGGLLGRETYQGGWKTALLGLVLHFLIAMIWATVYYAASLRLPLLHQQAVLCGLLFGVVVYLTMYAVVLPLSALRFQFFNQSAVGILTAVLIHLFCVGWPIALTIRRQS